MYVVMAAVFGVLCSLAFDPANVPLAMLIGVAGFLAVLRTMGEARTRAVAAVGAGFGLGLMAPLIWWMNAVSPGAYVGLVLAQVPFFALLAVCLRRVMRLPLWPVWGAAIWVGIELFRSSFPFSGFPWGRLAHTGIDTPFASYVRLIGTPGTSAVMFLAAAAIAYAATRRTPRHVALAVASVMILLGVGAALPTGIAGKAETKQVALVQGDVPGVFGTWPVGEIFEMHADETERLAARIEAGQHQKPDFVLWPENSTDIDPDQSTDGAGGLSQVSAGLKVPTMDTRVRALSTALGAPILVGGIFNGPTTETAYNAGVVWDENGPGERYIKRKVVPYGEYVPFRNVLGGLVPRFDRDIPRDMLGGKKAGVLELAGVKIGDTICWDIAYDGNIRDNINGGAQVLVVQTSNASFTGTSQPQQQWKISRLRAIETGRYVLVPSTNGITGIVDPQGRTVARAATETPAVLSAEIRLANGMTSGVRFGGVIEYALVALGLVGLIIGRRRRKGVE
jgi:apolipoprotein N-acyltransferase